MRILHIGKSLPDMRIEKTILLDIGRGDEPALILYDEFKNKEFNIKEIAATKYFIKVGKKNILGFGRKGVKKQIDLIIDEFKPDLLHVHDIHNAIFVYGTKIPWIYNDHEGWSIEGKYRRPSLKLFSFRYWYHMVGWFLKYMNIIFWEDKILDNRITITVSKGISEMHTKKKALPKIMHNFPMQSEIDRDINVIKRNNSMVYIGGDFDKNDNKYRDSKGLLKIAVQECFDLTIIGNQNINSQKNIKSLGFINHYKIYNEINDIQFGLLPYKPHEFQKITDPNKVYIYTHMGLIIIGPYTYNFNHIPAFRKYNHFSEIKNLINLETQAHELPENIIKYAKENLVWEKQSEIYASVIKSLMG